MTSVLQVLHILAGEIVVVAMVVVFVIVTMTRAAFAVWTHPRRCCEEGGGYEGAGLRRVQGCHHRRHCHAFAAGESTRPSTRICRSSSASSSFSCAPALNPPLLHHPHQGFKFLGKAMKITYARGTSDIIARANGTPPPAHALYVRLRLAQRSRAQCCLRC